MTKIEFLRLRPEELRELILTLYVKYRIGGRSIAQFVGLGKSRVYQILKEVQ